MTDDYPIPQAAIDIIKLFEGCNLQPYKDSAGLLSIGIGHLIKSDEDFGDDITQDEADELLRKDLQQAAIGVEGTVSRTDLNDNQLSALISFTFNLGVTRLLSSTLLRDVNAGNDANVPAEFNRWIYAGNEVVEGLVRRRKAEGELYARLV